MNSHIASIVDRMIVRYKFKKLHRDCPTMDSLENKIAAVLNQKYVSHLKCEELAQIIAGFDSSTLSACRISGEMSHARDGEELLHMLANRGLASLIFYRLQDMRSVDTFKPLRRSALAA